MMLDMALLCQAAAMQGPLMNVLGGGITRFTFPEFPATMDAALAVRMNLHHTETGTSHSLQVILQDEDGNRLFDVNVEMECPPAGPEMKAEDLVVPLAFNLEGPLEKPGSYSLELLIDGNHHKTVSFTAALQDGGKDGQQGSG